MPYVESFLEFRFSQLYCISTYLI